MASEIPGAIFATGLIFARTTQTFVNIPFAIYSGPSGQTIAGKISDSIHATTIYARGGQTIVDINFALAAFNKIFSLFYYKNFQKFKKNEKNEKNLDLKNFFSP